MRSPKREKTFGPGRLIPLDRNAKARIQAYAAGRNAMLRQPGQHRGPITRATTEVLQALLFGFHNSKSGLCFPSYEAIADRAKCCRDTVYEAIKALELAGVLTWVHRIWRKQVRERDLFGKWVLRSRILRTSNAYTFRDPNPGHTRPPGRFSSKSENPTGTPNQDFQLLSLKASEPAPASAALEAALAALGRGVQGRLLTNGGAITA